AGDVPSDCSARSIQASAISVSSFLCSAYRPSSVSRTQASAYRRKRATFSLSDKVLFRRSLFRNVNGGMSKNVPQQGSLKCPGRPRGRPGTPQTAVWCLRRRGEIAEPLEVLFLLLVARRQLEQARRGAAEDVVLRLLRQERQVRDGRGQIEVPVRIVRGVHQLRLRIDHAERAL